MAKKKKKIGFIDSETFIKQDLKRNHDKYVEKQKKEKANRNVGAPFLNERSRQVMQAEQQPRPNIKAQQSSKSGFKRSAPIKTFSYNAKQSQSSKTRAGYYTASNSERRNSTRYKYGAENGTPAERFAKRIVPATKSTGNTFLGQHRITASEFSRGNENNLTRMEREARRGFSTRMRGGRNKAYEFSDKKIDEGKLKQGLKATQKAIKEGNKEEMKRAFAQVDKGEKQLEEAKKGLGSVGKFALDMYQQGGLIGLDTVATLGKGTVYSMMSRASGGGYKEAREKQVQEKKTEAIKEFNKWVKDYKKDNVPHSKSDLKKMNSEIQKKQKELNKKLSSIDESKYDFDTKSALYGAGAGLVEGATEKLFAPFKASKKLFGKGIFDSADDMLIKKGARALQKAHINNEVAHKLSKIGVGMAEEGAEEVISSLANPLVAKATYDKNALQEYKTKEFYKNLGYDFAMGSAMGGALGGTGAVVGKALSSRNNSGKLTDEVKNNIFAVAKEQKEGSEARKRVEKLELQKQRGYEPSNDDYNEVRGILTQELINSAKVDYIGKQSAKNNDSSTENISPRAVIENVANLAKNEFETKKVKAENVSRFERDANVTTEGEKFYLNNVISNKIEEANGFVGELLTKSNVLSDNPMLASEQVNTVSQLVTGTLAEEKLTNEFLNDNDIRNAIETSLDVKLPVNNDMARATLKEININNYAENHFDIITEAKNGYIDSVLEPFAMDIGEEGYTLAKDILLKTETANYENVLQEMKNYINGGIVAGKGSGNRGYISQIESRNITNLLSSKNRAKLFDYGFKVGEAEKQSINRRKAVIAEGKKENISATKKKGSVSYKKVSSDYMTEQGEISRKIARETLGSKELRLFEQIADALGVKINFFNGNSTYRGFYIDDTVNININNSSPIDTFKHEITHYLQEHAPQQYKEFKNFIFEKFYNNSKKQYNAKVNEIIELYKDNGVNLAVEQAEDEVLANATDIFLRDEAQFKELVKGNKTMAEKLLESLQTLLQAIRTVISKYKQTTFEGEFMNDIGVLEKAEKMWLNALKSVSENNNVSSQNNTNNSDVQFSIQKDNKGREYVLLDGNVMKNKPSNMKIHDYIASVIGQHIGKYYTLIENGYKIFIGADLPGEYTQSKYTKDLISNYKSQKLLVKHEIIGNIKEVIEIARKRQGSQGAWESNTKEKHNVDAKLGFYKFKSTVGLQRKDGKIQKYRLTLVVRNEGNGKKYLYDIQTIEKTGGLLSPVTQGNSTYSHTQKGGTPPAKYSKTISNKKQTVNNKKDSDGNVLTKEQENFFKDSKVVDSNGNLKVMYHGSNNKFFVFDTNKFGEVGSTAKGYGIYFIDDVQTANHYGKNIFKCYLNAKKLASTTAKTLTKGEVENLVKHSVDVQAKTMLDDGYNTLEDAQKDTWVSNYVDTYNADMDSVYADVTQQLYDNNDNDVDLIHEIMNVNGVGGVNGYKEANKFYSEVLTPATGVDGFTFNFGNEKGVIVFESSQIKETTNKKPTLNDDIRFQLKNVSEENTKLKKHIEELKGEFKRSKIAKPIDKEVNREISKLIKAYTDGKMDSRVHSEVKAEVEKIFDEIRNNNTDDIHYISDCCMEAGRIIASESVRYVNDQENEYRDIKHTLKMNKLKVDDTFVAEAGGKEEYNAFRRGLFGTVTLSKTNGRSIDQVYNELAGIYPWLFDNEKYTSAYDQVTNIIQVLDDLKPYYEAYDKGMAKEMASDIATDIYDLAYGLSVSKTFADKKAEEKNKAVAQIKERYQSKLSELKRTKNAEMKEKVLAERNKQIETLKTRYNAKIEKQKQKFKEKEQTTKEKAKDKTARTKAFDKIEKEVKYLSERLLSPTEKKHVPEGLRSAIAQTLKGLDLTKKRTEEWEARKGIISSRTLKFNKLKVECDKILHGEDSTIELDNDIEDLFNAVASYENVRIESLETAELENVAKLLHAVTRAVQTANKTFNTNLKQTISELGDTIINENGKRKEKTEYDGFWGATKNFFGGSMTKPTDFFAIMGGTAETLYKEIRKAHRDFTFKTKDSLEFMQKLIKNNDDVHNWTGKKAITKEYKLSNGSKIELTTAQVMSLYCLSKREQALNHIYEGGVVSVPTTKRLSTKRLKNLMPRLVSQTKVTVNYEDVQNIINTLTEEQKTMADKIQNYLSETCSEWGNETSMKLYDIKKFKEKNYFPIQSSKQFLAQSFDVKGDSKLKNFSATKSLVPNANNPIVIDDIFKVYTKHTSAMANYSAYVPSITDFERVLNYKTRNVQGEQVSVRESIERAYGKKAFAYIENWLRYLNQNYTKQTSDLELHERALNNMKKASIGANIRVLVQQPTSIVRSLILLNPSDFIFAKDKLKFSKAKAEMQEKNATAYWKSLGFFQTDTARSLYDMMLDNSTISDRAMDMYGKADDMAWTYMWLATKRSVERKYKNIKIGSDEYWEKVNDEFDYMVDRTQVVDSPFNRSQIMRSNDLFAKGLTAFQAEPTTTYNMLKTEMIFVFRDWKMGNKAEASKRLSRLLASYLLNGLAVSGAAATIDILRTSIVSGNDDDDKENDQLNILEKWLKYTKKNLVPNLVGLVPMANDIMNIFDGYGNDRLDLQGLKAIYKGITTFRDGKYTLFQVTKDIAKAISLCSGIPLYNAMRDLQAVGNAAMTKIVGKDLGDYYRYAQRYVVSNEKNAKYFKRIYGNAYMHGNIKEAEKIKEKLKSNDFNMKKLKSSNREIKDMYIPKFEGDISNGNFKKLEQHIKEYVNITGAKEETVRKLVSDRCMLLLKNSFKTGTKEESLNILHTLSKIKTTASKEIKKSLGNTYIKSMQEKDFTTAEKLRTLAQAKRFITKTEAGNYALNAYNDERFVDEKLDKPKTKVTAKDIEKYVFKHNLMDKDTWEYRKGLIPRSGKSKALYNKISRGFNEGFEKNDINLIKKSANDMVKRGFYTKENENRYIKRRLIAKYYTAKRNGDTDEMKKTRKMLSELGIEYTPRGGRAGRRGGGGGRRSAGGGSRSGGRSSGRSKRSSSGGRSSKRITTGAVSGGTPSSRVSRKKTVTGRNGRRPRTRRTRRSRSS